MYLKDALLDPSLSAALTSQEASYVRSWLRWPDLVWMTVALRASVGDGLLAFSGLSVSWAGPPKA